MTSVDSGDPAIRIVIVDDAWHYARALEAALAVERDFQIIAVEYSSADAARVALEHVPDVLLLGLDMPNPDGLAAAERLRAEAPGIGIVVITARNDEGSARACLATGVRAFLVKLDHTDPDRIAGAIRSVARGDLFLDRSTHQLLERLAAAAVPGSELGLTSRERDVLLLLAEGLQNKQLAIRLGLSEQTVRNHLSSAYRKLGTTNRTETVVVARRHGILP